MRCPQDTMGTARATGSIFGRFSARLQGPRRPQSPLTGAGPQSPHRAGPSSRGPRPSPPGRSLVRARSPSPPQPAGQQEGVGPWQAPHRESRAAAEQEDAQGRIAAPGPQRPRGTGEPRARARTARGGAAPGRAQRAVTFPRAALSPKVTVPRPRAGARSAHRRRPRAGRHDTSRRRRRADGAAARAAAENGTGARPWLRPRPPSPAHREALQQGAKLPSAPAPGSAVARL